MKIRLRGLVRFEVGASPHQGGLVALYLESDTALANESKTWECSLTVEQAKIVGRELLDAAKMVQQSRGSPHTN